LGIIFGTIQQDS